MIFKNFIDVRLGDILFLLIMAKLVMKLLYLKLFSKIMVIGFLVKILPLNIIMFKKDIRRFILLFNFLVRMLFYFYSLNHWQS